MSTLDEITNQARSESLRTPIETVHGRLDAALGEKLKAFVLGGDSREATEDEVRRVFELYLFLAPLDDDATIRAWLIGMNPMIDEQAPAELLANGEIDDAFVVARAFATLG